MIEVRREGPSRRCLGLACALALCAASAQAATVPDLVSSGAAARLGAAPAALPLHVLVTLPLHHQAELDRMLARVTTPGNPDYGHYLSVAEFTRRFGPTDAEYRAAAAFFAAKGLRVTAGAPNRFMLQLDGTVADMQRSFNVTMNLYRTPDGSRTFYAPDREPEPALATPLLDVIGLDNAVPPRSRLLRSQSPAASGTGSGPSGNYIASDIRAAYYGSGPLTGAGQSVGLMELGPFDAAAVQTFFANYGPTNSVPVNAISTDGSPVSCTNCSDGEQDLDIEYAIGMAPGLAQVQVYVGNTAEATLNRMASDNTSRQLSTSWGWNKIFNTDDALFKEMAVQGQTLLTASGDYSSLSRSGPWPEEDANITAVGGTHFVTTGPAGHWAGETGWSYSAGGPSLDKRITIEPYQLPFINTANRGSTTLRNVPDIAAVADYQMQICQSTGCTGGWGGTSFASPILAGLVALANQRAAATGHGPIGFLNPTIYSYGQSTSYGTLFHDIRHGRSGHFICTPSYDLVTGLGSPKGVALVKALGGL
jgi:kumamolisin